MNKDDLYQGAISVCWVNTECLCLEESISNGSRLARQNIYKHLECNHPQVWRKAVHVLKLANKQHRTFTKAAENEF